MTQDINWQQLAEIKKLKDALDNVVFIGRGYNIEHPFGTKFDNVNVGSRFRRKK